MCFVERVLVFLVQPPTGGVVVYGSLIGTGTGPCDRK